MLLRVMCDCRGKKTKMNESIVSVHPDPRPFIMHHVIFEYNLTSVISAAECENSESEKGRRRTKKLRTFLRNRN